MQSHRSRPTVNVDLLAKHDTGKPKLVNPPKATLAACSVGRFAASTYPPGFSCFPKGANMLKTQPEPAEALRGLLPPLPMRMLAGIGSDAFLAPKPSMSQIPSR